MQRVTSNSENHPLLKIHSSELIRNSDLEPTYKATPKCPLEFQPFSLILSNFSFKHVIETDLLLRTSVPKAKKKQGYAQRTTCKIDLCDTQEICNSRVRPISNSSQQFQTVASAIPECITTNP